MANTPLAHALTAAAHGFRVIPLTRAKLPAVRSPHHHAPVPLPCRGACGRLGHGIHDASAEPETIRALFAAAPWATGYGIACGCAPHHLIGVDLDLKHEPRIDGAAAFALLARRYAFAVPRTVTVLTPGGGRHLWLCGPPGLAVPNSAGRIAPGIDIRGAGGYLVGPGSATARGHYRLAPGSPAWCPAPAPAALLSLLRPPARTPVRTPVRTLPDSDPPIRTSPGPDAALVRFVRASQEGRRNDRLFWAACRAYETGAGDELAPALVEAALHTGLTRREAEATVASAARSTTGRPLPPVA
ncbi:bifunctional DNA primase/polymerase [Streptomyces sp. NPDC021098]|uniref:bifunctional DNA primase/polymerase n=1 Tax=unclassified Streptomyces TaxID=2593676 RepID=UPI0037BA1466